MLVSLNLLTLGVGLHHAQPKKVSLSRALSYDICHITKDHRSIIQAVRVCECTRDRLLAERKHHDRREVVDTRAFAAAFGFVVGGLGRKLEAARSVPASNKGMKRNSRGVRICRRYRKRYHGHNCRRCL